MTKDWIRFWSGTGEIGLAVIASVALAACNESGSAPAQGLACGDKTCASTQVCCIDCDGKGACGAPGTACPGFACPGDAGAGCGGQGQLCCQLTQGDPPCSTGLVCCTGVPYPEHGSCHPKCELKSDRAAKRDVRAVDADRLLEQLAALPISSWSYAAERGVRHVGPMAQDFKAAFAVGSTAQRIDLVDANGVALAAIQALHRRVRGLERELAALRRAK